MILGRDIQRLASLCMEACPTADPGFGNWPENNGTWEAGSCTKVQW